MLKIGYPFAWCWCELFDFLGLLTCLCDLHAGLACNYCLANHYPSDGVCLECVEQDPGFPGMLLGVCVFGGVWVELRCFLVRDVKCGGLVCVWKWGFFAFLFVKSWVGLEEAIYCLCCVRQRVFFFRFCREYPQIYFGELWFPFLAPKT